MTFYPDVIRTIVVLKIRICPFYAGTFTISAFFGRWKRYRITSAFVDIDNWNMSQLPGKVLDVFRIVCWISQIIKNSCPPFAFLRSLPRSSFIRLEIRFCVCSFSSHNLFWQIMAQYSIEIFQKQRKRGKNGEDSEIWAKKWHLQWESNPCCRDENPVS